MNDPFDLMTLFALEDCLKGGFREMLNAARAARPRLTQVGAEAFQATRFSREVVADLRALRLPEPATDDGKGFVMRELEHADSSLRRFASVQGDLVLGPLEWWASPAQQARYQYALQEGRAVACCGLVEPGTGGDPERIRMQAQTVPGGYLLDGVKVAVDCAPIADFALVWARVGEGDAGLRGFLIPRGREGFATPEVRHKHTLRGASMGEVVLTRCFVGDDEVLPDAVGTGPVLDTLAGAGFSTAWGVLGAALCCYESVLRHARRRTRAEGALLTQERLMEMVAGIVQGHLMAHGLARLAREYAMTPAAVAVALRHNLSVALDIARTTRAVLEAAGAGEDDAVMRHAANLENVAAWEAAHAPALVTVGRMAAAAVEPS